MIANKGFLLVSIVLRNAIATLIERYKIPENKRIFFMLNIFMVNARGRFVNEL